MQRIQHAAAQAVQSVLAGTNLGNALARQVQKSGLNERERASVQALSYGTLRYLGLLRFILDRLVKRPPGNETVTFLLLVALYQLEFGKSAHYAVVDHAVKAAGTIGGRSVKPFVNAVLREYLRQRKELIGAARRDDLARFSYPRWWIEKLREQLGSQRAHSVLETGNEHPLMTVRVNRRRMRPEQYLALLAEHDMEATVIGAQAVLLAIPVGVADLPGFSDGLVSVQDAGAQISAQLLDAQPGDNVVDACAAPGGKTGHILELADVSMTALDRDAERLERISENLQRLHLTANLQCVDAADLGSWWDGKQVERVLLDAPCSASGIVRRHPDIKWLRREEDIDGFRQQQQRLLEALWQVVAQGGKLLYVTCSIFREENEEQVDWFLSRHTDASLALRTDIHGSALLLPSKEHDGFFHALFEKV